MIMINIDSVNGIGDSLDTKVEARKGYTIHYDQLNSSCSD